MSDRQQTIRRLDQLTSLIVRRRDRCCVLCGSTLELTNGHIFSRSREATRWDIAEDGNCHCQCWECNKRHVTDKKPYWEWYKRRFGPAKLEELRCRSLQPRQMKGHLLEAMAAEYRSILGNMPETGFLGQEEPFFDPFSPVGEWSEAAGGGNKNRTCPTE